jgi:hypothetical protein
MMGVVVGVLGLFAVFSWAIAVISAVQIVRLAPKGQRMRTYGRIGWWRFDENRREIGPAADPHIQAYQRAFVAFIVCVVGSIGVSTLLSLTARN